MPDDTSRIAAQRLATQVLAACRQQQIMLATAESCTGGLVSAALTAIAGSSDVMERGFVTYSNEAKSEMLGVHAALISAHGAVSQQVAEAMARGALAHSRAGIAVSITGIAGPGGGSMEKPVGLVHLACALAGHETRALKRLYGALPRDDIRAAAVCDALQLVLDMLAGSKPG